MTGPIERTYLDSPDAARELGVSRATLYAYVSRGLVRSEPRPGGGRERRYRAEDIRALARRREQRGDPAQAASDALHFGAPLLDSGLALIADGRLYYRGHAIEDLVGRRSIEEVAMLLWTGQLEAPFPDAPFEPPPAWDALRRAARRLPALEACQIALVAVSARDAGAWDPTPASVMRVGARILRVLAAVVADAPVSRRPISEVLRRGWALATPDARALLDALLVAWADHELNVSTFTTRCVASAAATPYAAVVAGLSALRGVRHGGASEQVEALFAEVDEPERARAVLEARLRRGDRLPGFGHPLYPTGDPRARLLGSILRAARPAAPALATADALERAAFELIRRRPNIDFASVALCRTLGLPAGAPLALICIGRSVGWIAHVLEQYADPRLIRPRARYVGEPPRGPSP
jgi:citrate synthase